ncbi:MAG: hypothetical protein JRJ77_17205 [Deltaproteobacteria bacterium]|nr:hypothetical protein [Deltaproteobacteria bacterium]MBW1796258.1 hypothetical protein [Deltaproteobacteria bacterium]
MAQAHLCVFECIPEKNAKNSITNTPTTVANITLSLFLGFMGYGLIVQKNTNSLIEERDKFLSSNTSENNILSAILYTNTIQQNIALENTYRQQSDHYVTKREGEKLNLEKLNGELNRVLEEIKSLEFKKDGA